MSEGLNKVMLLGNLGADPELRHTQSGEPVLNLRLATTEVYFDRERVKKERTDWHSVVVWGKRGEALSRILRKGSQIHVEGSLRTSSYDARDGSKRYKTEVNARNVLLLGGRPSDGDSYGQRLQGNAAPPAQPPPDDYPQDDYDDGGAGF